jgi:hypothetical protein
MDKITTFEQFTSLLDAMVKTQEAFSERFPTGQSKVDIAGWLIRLFGEGCLFYVETYSDNELKFLSVIEVVEEQSHWHILYSHPRYKYKTKQVVNEIKDDLRARGVEVIYSKTRRVTPSYKRWMVSLDSYPYEIRYKCKLK